ncbi:2-hydroxyacid dehydrogenase [Primorskyibacter sp. S87]|uniref:2-hydroxyacid dehydrogenase n=1 Tax=Primorskyibacter sp. S87 TaxID=3415126 RepID=UPI003C7ACC32
MALLIDIGLSGWIDEEELANQIRTYLSRSGFSDDVVRTNASIGNPEDITMMAVSNLGGDRPAQFPNLALVQKLGAGVETIVTHPALPPQVRVTRLRPDEPAREIAEWFLAYILRTQRNMDAHSAAQRNSEWEPIEPRSTPATTVGVLGLGTIGNRTARMLHSVGFRVKGWSRSPKAIEGVDCMHGEEGLSAILRDSDFLCAILPSTQETRGLMGMENLGRMKSGAVLLNAGRGDLVDEPALLRVLDTGPVAHAVLDVVQREPLPAGDPLWMHPKVTITPHVSGWHLGDALGDVAENYRRLSAGKPLLHEVDRKRGY